MSNDKSVSTGTGRHNYECGILPNILLNKFSSKISENQSYTGCATTSHLAYRCIANTDPGRLRSYLTSHDTGALVGECLMLWNFKRVLTKCYNFRLPPLDCIIFVYIIYQQAIELFGF